MSTLVRKLDEPVNLEFLCASVFSIILSLSISINAVLLLNSVQQFLRKCAQTFKLRCHGKIFVPHLIVVHNQW